MAEVREGLYGISFPFHINSQGGVAMSRANGLDVTHLEESMKHIIYVRPYERVMLPEFNTNLDIYIFDRNDISAQSLIKFEIMRALSIWETRVTVHDVTFKEDDSILYATIYYSVNAILTPNTYVYTVRLGGINQ